MPYSRARRRPAGGRRCPGQAPGGPMPFQCCWVEGPSCVVGAGRSRQESVAPVIGTLKVNPIPHSLLLLFSAMQPLFSLFHCSPRQERATQKVSYKTGRARKDSRLFCRPSQARTKCPTFFPEKAYECKGKVSLFVLPLQPQSNGHGEGGDPKLLRELQCCFERREVCFLTKKCPSAFVTQLLRRGKPQKRRYIIR